MPNVQRFYRQVTTIDDAHTAIKELTDHVYELRQRLDAHHEQLGKITTGSASAASKPTLNSGLNSQIAGISVKSVTDPSTLKNGYTIRYNAATGQFEFGV